MVLEECVLAAQALMTFYHVLVISFLKLRRFPDATCICSLIKSIPVASSVNHPPEF